MFKVNLHPLLLLSSLLIWQVLLAPALADEDASALAGIDLSGLGSDVRVVDKVGEFIPQELKFRNEQGQPVKLEQYFNQDKTILLTLNYSDCPGLCIAQLENLVATLKGIDGQGLADSFEILTVSIDPSEQPEKAARTKAKYTEQLKSSNAKEGWHFLVGDQPEIEALAKSLGYYYTYDKQNNRFNHPAVLYFVSSNGRLCRYLADLGVEPKQLQLAVSEASEGKLNRSLAETFIQYCYSYDPAKNRYSADAKRIMAVGFTSFAVLMGGFLAPFWFGNKKTPNVTQSSDASRSDDGSHSNS